ncbi:hypothetical protein R1sor_010923 [Riccia sorocarpa]|uniref:Uncharacterized protein n=1 Tax=Riccia sorocarpa TaxID=122646 RepID=A0ABD3I253_9MARC
MDETTRLGSGGMGLTHRVGIIDEELAEVLGHHEVIHYALKVMHRRAGDKKVHEKCIREMMTFPESHTAIIRPIGLNKDKKKPMLLFPLWNGGTIEKCMNLEKSTRGRISSEGICLIDQKHRDSMNADEWLNIQLFRKHRELCGDYFTEMTDEERREYNRDARDKGLPYPDAADVHARRLKEALDLMTWEKIRSPYGNQRRNMDYWAHYFSEQLFIDPDTCARPIERGPRGKVHPDGPQKVSRGNA